MTDRTADRTERDRTDITTSSDGLSTTTTQDLDGDGVADLTTTASKSLNADGSTTLTTTDTNQDGLRDQSVATTSADGLSTTIQNQFDGSVTFSQTETITTAANGDVVDTLSRNAPGGGLIYTSATTTSADGLSKTTQVDVNGDGVVDLTTTDATVLDPDGSRAETVTKTGSAGLIAQSVTTTSADGLSKTVQSDTTGDDAFDLTTTDTTVLDADGSEVETDTQANQDGSTRNSTVTTTSADGNTVTIARTLGQHGSQNETVHKAADGSVVDTLSGVDATGAALGSETITTSANGLSKVARYADASGLVVDTQSDLRALNADGSTTETFSDADVGAAAYDLVVTTTSADGLSKQSLTQFSGVGMANYTTSDVTTLNNDGTTGEVATTRNADGSVRDQRLVDTSADGLTTTFSVDANGFGTPDFTRTTATATDGSKTQTTTLLNSATGAQQEQDVVTTSADGRTTTLTSARDGDPTATHFETTSISPDNSISDHSSVANDDGAPNYDQTRTQTFNPDGGQTVTISNSDGAGHLEDRSTTTTSGNGLSIHSDIDVTGDGVADEHRSDITVINADGSKVETIRQVSDVDATNQKLDYQDVITTSADGLVVTTQVDNDGDGIFEKTETSTRHADGSLTNIVAYANAPVVAEYEPESPTLLETVSADGLVETTTAGNVKTTKTTLAGANGSYTWTETSPVLLGGPIGATHSIDGNGVDTWTSTYGPSLSPGSGNYGVNQTKTIQIDVSSETAAIAQANAIYQTALGRQMTDDETQSLIQYMTGGVLDRAQLSGSLVRSGPQLDGTFVSQLYQNAFGHGPSASDLATYLDDLSRGTFKRAQVVDDVAEKATDEKAGNGLLQLLPNGPEVTPDTGPPLPADAANLVAAGAAYSAFDSATGQVSGKPTTSQINNFTSLTQAGAKPFASAPTFNFPTATSPSGFFGGSAEPGAAAPTTTGGAGPLVVNLGGGTVQTTDPSTSSVKFDFSGSGTKTPTSWITPNEGFLVLDPNGQQFNDGKPLIPTFAAAAQYDINNDGVLTAAEADAAGVKIWVDANSDGIGQTSELETFKQAGIASINLNATSTGVYNHGSITAADSSVTFTNGRSGDVADAWLAFGSTLQNGAVYQFNNNVVVRSANGTADELFYGAGQTIDAGISGVSKIVDTGSNNTLQAGSAPTVTLSGSANDTLVGGTGANTLLAIGASEKVTTGSGSNEVLASGTSTSVAAGLGSSTIVLQGSNESVVGGTSKTTVDVTTGTGASIAATGSSIDIATGASASGVRIRRCGHDLRDFKREPGGFLQHLAGARFARNHRGQWLERHLDACCVFNGVSVGKQRDRQCNLRLNYACLRRVCRCERQ